MENKDHTPMSINEYYNYNSGIDPTAKHAIALQIKEGKIYVVHHQEKMHQVSVDENDNFFLKAM